MPNRFALSAIWFVCGMTYAGDIHFKRHVINAHTDYSAAALMDVNRDGQIDIMCGGEWYEGPGWEKHFVAEIPRIGGRPDGFAHLPFDVNRDGWTDLITVNYRSRSIKWMEHPGAQLGPWTTHVAVEPGPMETGRLVDIDRDGKLDLLPNGARFAAWWEFRWKDSEQGEPTWIRHDLPAEAGGHGLGFGDINGDGRGDIVGQNGWLEAPEDARSGRWRWHADFRLERASIPMLIVDVDQDGDTDIVWCSAHGFGVYWLEHTVDTSQQQHHWDRHAIDTSWSQGHSPLWHDLDGDGRAELITGKRYMAHGGSDPGEYDPIAIYRYQFDPTSRTWNRWTISGHGQRVGVGLDPKVDDIDGDGDPDLLASGRSGLYWLENLGAHKAPSVPSTSPSVPTYDKHDELLVVNLPDGSSQPVSEPEAWGVRRSHIVSSIEGAHGPIPDSSQRVPLEMVVHESRAGDAFLTQVVEYRIDANRSARATLRIPESAEPGNSIGLVCIFDESSGLESRTRIAEEICAAGFVCITPKMQAPIDADQDPLMDGVWQVIRAADLLQASEWVHGERIGYVGNAMDGQLGLYVAALDQRIRVTLTDLSNAKSLTAAAEPRYSLAELIACVAPRTLTLNPPSSPELRSILQDHQDLARPVFELRRAASRLTITGSVFDASFDERLAAWQSLKTPFQPRRRFSRPRSRPR